MTSSDKPGPRDFDRKIVEEANRAWLSAFFASPAAHRSNAQAGYTVAAAVAAAIVGAGILASVGTAPWWLQATALVTLGLWLAAAVAFMRAVAIQPDLGGVVHQREPGVMAQQAIQRTWDERTVIARRSGLAQRIALAAVAATFATVIVLMLSAAVSDDGVDATIALTPGGRIHYTQLCGKPARTVRGRLDPGDLSEDFIPLADADCGAGTGVTLQLRASDVAAVAGP